MTCKKIVTLRIQKQMMRKRVKEKKKSEQKKESEKKIESGKSERKTKKQWSFYAKASDVKNAFYTNQPIFVLLYKETCFNTNELDESFPSVVVSLLQEYKDMFSNDVPSGLPPIRGIEHQIDFVLGATISQLTFEFPLSPLGYPYRLVG